MQMRPVCVEIRMGRLMDRLEKRGYRLRISDWVGRLGNHLIQLSCAINVAQKTGSILTIPVHDMICRNTYDFRVSGEARCNDEVSGRFFTQADCYQFPIRHDAERRQIFQEFVLNQLIRKTWSQKLREKVFRTSEAPLDSKTLVVNMRSGRDIFRSDPPPQSDYMQPPLSFYKHIIETYDYRDCLIVTEPDLANPVIPALLSWGQNRNIQLKKHRSVQDDIDTVLNAKHLVAAHSTFTWCLAMMSRNLKVYHQPHTCRILGITDFSVHTYEYFDYIQPGEWRGTAEQLDVMVNHPVANVKSIQHSESPELPMSACS